MTPTPGLRAAPPPPPPLITWTQNAAIFACCAVLISTALASLSFVIFLMLFFCVCASSQRKHLDTQYFPKGVGIAMAIYVAWQVIGISYSGATASYALETIYSDRKILFILPLVLLFSAEEPKRRFLSIFLALAIAGLLLSFALAMPRFQHLLTSLPFQLVRSSAPLAPENIFRSYATQGMVFAMCSFLSLWFASQQPMGARRWILYAVAALFMLNIATLTSGRSGYVVFLVLIVWTFVMRRGFKGVILGAGVAIVIGGMTFFLSSTVHQRVMKGVAEIENFSTAPAETSLGRRMVMYDTTLGIIREHPILGIGTGGFRQRFTDIAAEKYTGWRAKPADDPHNQYLFILAENGLIGLAAFAGVIATLLKYGLKTDSPYGKMAAGCLLAWCATSLFSGHFRTFPEGHLIAFIVGILMVSRPVEHQPRSSAIPELAASSNNTA